MIFIQSIDVGLIIIFLLDIGDQTYSKNYYVFPFKWIFANLDNGRALFLLLDVIFSRVHHNNSLSRNPRNPHINTEPIFNVDFDPYTSEDSQLRKRSFVHDFTVDWDSESLKEVQAPQLAALKYC